MSKLEKPVPVERRIFSTNVKAARKHAKLTLQQVSDITNISLQFISMIEIGNQNVTIHYMAELSYAVEVPLYVLLSPRFKADTFDPKIWEEYAQLVQKAKPDILELKLLAENTRRYRKLVGLTQAQVDQLAGFRNKTTSDIERQGGNMGMDLIIPIAPVLEIPLFRLFEPF
jgi:transcriptional regulator with XRE-family HTH domain